MPTKAQAKTAIDNVATAIKADIDNILPAGVNIVDGSIQFSPQHWNIKLDADGSLATADAWLLAIATNLGNASRTGVITRSGRRLSDGEKNIVIKTTLANYLIVNF